MRTIQEHNEEVRNYYRSTKNNIECPNCKSEMDDVDRGVLYLSNPPQTDIKCFNCGYTSKRYVIC